MWEALGTSFKVSIALSLGSWHRMGWVSSQSRVFPSPNLCPLPKQLLSGALRCRGHHLVCGYSLSRPVSCLAVEAPCSAFGGVCVSCLL